MDRVATSLSGTRHLSIRILFVLLLLALVSAPPLHAEAGNFVWALSMRGATHDAGNAIAVDAAGNVYTTGNFQETVDFDPGPEMYNLISKGGTDIFISKLDNRGNLVWARSMGGPSNDYGFGIAVDAAGNVYTTGGFTETADFDPGPGSYDLTDHGNWDIFVSKLDSSGNLVWARSMGGADSDYGIGIAVDSAGNVYSTGYFQGTVDFRPGPLHYNLTSNGSTDVFVSKLNSSGFFVWARSMGGASSDYGNGIAVDASGNVYATGDFLATADFDPGAGTLNLTSHGDRDIFVCKLDINGNLDWAKAMGGAAADRGRAIAVDSSGNACTTGYFQGIVDFRPGSGWYFLHSKGQEDIFISKLDSSGNFVWARSMGGPAGDFGRNVAVDSAGNVYTTGYFLETADFDPGPETLSLASQGLEDIFVNMLDSSGNLAWARSMGGPADDNGFGIAVDSAGNVYTTGTFQQTVDFDPGPATFNLVSEGGSEIYISKLAGYFPWLIYYPAFIHGTP
jgi:hypothetical protein